MLKEVDGQAPGYDRAELNIFTEDEWRRVKTNYILESWLQTARRTPKPIVRPARFSSGNARRLGFETLQDRPECLPTSEVRAVLGRPSIASSRLQKRLRYSDKAISRWWKWMESS